MPIEGQNQHMGHCIARLLPLHPHSPQGVGEVEVVIHQTLVNHLAVEVEGGLDYQQLQQCANLEI